MTGPVGPVDVVLLVGLGLLPHHLGALHPLEHALTLVLALGPLVLLAITVVVSRRRHDRDGDGPPA
ncbi:MAG: hypothetical protein JWR20_1958 [Marmoricola sp.]|nr:hypothetical protein [Marmoricola sp.]